MAKKPSVIEDLTPEQEAQLDVYMHRWTAIGLSTAPADRARAEDCVKRAYAVAELRPPKCSWAGSPRALLYADVEATASMAAAAAVEAVLAKGRPKNSLADMIYGSHDAGWLSRYAYMREVLGLREETEPLVPLLELALCCGWVLVLDGVAVLSERHSTLHLDPASGLPHSLTGPAIAYPDGYALFMVRGVTVPREWVEQRSTLDIRLALEHPNVEQRAAAAELIGWDRVLRELPHKVIDVETSDRYDYGKLLQVDLPDEPGQKFLQVLCATGRTMVLRVPPEMMTARQANAWSNGFDDATHFQPEGRT